MFIDEAKIAVQLQHANIAQIFDLGKVDESFFIALEYVHGRDLRVDLRSDAQQGRVAADRDGLLRHHAGLRGARLRAQQARRPGARAEPGSPGHFAPERADRLRGRVQADRLRHRQGGGQGLEDAGRHPQGEVRLHVARAGARPADRSAQRHLRGRHRALRAADRRAAVHGRERFLHAGEGPQRRDPAARRRTTRRSRRSWSGSCSRRWPGTPTTATRTPSICTTTCSRSCIRSASSSRARISRRG